MPLTHEQVELLARPFEIADHEQRAAGRGEWLTYLTEAPLIVRLSAVDPHWEFRITKDRVIPARPGSTDPDVTEVFAELTIAGVTRASVGTDAAKTENQWENKDGRNVKVGERVMSLDENSTKAAVTDALKRCARLFGVGSYLLSIPRLKAENETAAKHQFVAWYNTKFGVTKPATAPAPQATTTAAPTPPRTPIGREEAPSTTASGGQREIANNWATPAQIDGLIGWAQKTVWKAIDWSDQMPHLYNRIAKALGFTNDGTREGLHRIVSELVTDSRMEVRKLIQTYEPEQNPDLVAPTEEPLPF